MYTLSVERLAKAFGERKVFANVSFDIVQGRSLAVVGPNGSGKTTLLLILLRQLMPSSGTISLTRDSQPLHHEQLLPNCAFVSPYLQLYDSLTGEENLSFFTAFSTSTVDGKRMNQVLAEVGLEGRGSDLVKHYSSGMKQRLKYALALLRNPVFLFLDEPSANLDAPGKSFVHDLIQTSRRQTAVIIATNEPEEEALVDQVVTLAS